MTSTHNCSNILPKLPNFQKQQQQNYETRKETRKSYPSSGGETLLLVRETKNPIPHQDNVAPKRTKMGSWGDEKILAITIACGPPEGHST